MNDPDSLQALRAENTRLAALLDAHGIQWRSPPENASTGSQEPERTALEAPSRQPFGHLRLPCMRRRLPKSATNRVRGANTDSPEVESFTAHHRPFGIPDCHSWVVVGRLY